MTDFIRQFVATSTTLVISQQLVYGFVCQCMFIKFFFFNSHTSVCQTLHIDFSFQSHFIVNHVIIVDVLIEKLIISSLKLYQMLSFFDDKEGERRKEREFLVFPCIRRIRHSKNHNISCDAYAVWRAQHQRTYTYILWCHMVILQDTNKNKYWVSARMSFISVLASILQRRKIRWVWSRNKSISVGIYNCQWNLDLHFHIFSYMFGV